MKMSHAFVLILVVALSSIAVSAGAAEEFELGPALEIIEEPAPETQKPGKIEILEGLTVDTGSRAAVAEFFDSTYRASEGFDAAWTGSVDTCTPGTTAQDYEDATLLRVNYYRAMAGLNADITFSDTFDAQCQQAALIMIAEGNLSHTPPNTWACWTQEGYDAARASNIAIGVHGPAAIDGYIKDPGTGNERVGHRNWILFQLQQVMGSGSTTARNGFFNGANALWVIDQNSWNPRPATPRGIAWPPEGYVPQQVVYSRWSFSYYQADFTSATVAMEEDGNPVNLNIIFSNSGTGYLPDNIIAWEPEGLPTSPPSQDITYSVTISNVLIGGDPEQFTYDVIVIDPDRVVVEPTATPVPVTVTRDNLFDLSVNWLADGYDGPADVNGDDQVNEQDVFTAIRNWKN